MIVQLLDNLAYHICKTNIKQALRDNVNRVEQRSSLTNKTG